MGLDDLRFVGMTLARIATFASHALLFGLAVVIPLVLRPSVGALDHTWDAGRRRLGERLESMIQASLIAAAISTTVTLVLQATVIAELKDGDLGSNSFMSVFDSSYGRWYLLRIPLLVGTAVLLGGRVRQWALAGAGDSRSGPGRSWWLLWGGLGLGLLSTLTFSGHAPVATPRSASEVNDVLHLMAGSIWFSGIILLSVVLPDGWRGRPARERLQLLAPAVMRFSTVALVAMGVVAITGTINSLLHVGALDDLIDSSYGRWLAVKIGLFLMIIVLGATNHFYVRNQLRKGNENPAPAAAQRLFRRTIAIELVLALLVLGATGVLVGMARTKFSVPPSGTFSFDRAP